MDSYLQTQQRASLVVDNDTQRTGAGLDLMRKNARAYEYLCHLEEAKRWLELVLGDELPPPDRLSDRFSNGVVLAKVRA